MARHLVHAAIVCGVMTGFAADVAAQGLGEVAKREAERRAKVKEAGKVITNDDLKLLAPDRPTIAAPAAPAAAAADAAKTAPDAVAAPAPPVTTPTEPEVPGGNPKRDEQHWRERAKLYRDRLEGLRANALAMEARIATLEAQRPQTPADRMAALNQEIQQATQDRARFEKQIALIAEEQARFEDRARDAKIPQIWIR